MASEQLSWHPWQGVPRSSTCRRGAVLAVAAVALGLLDLLDLLDLKVSPGPMAPAPTKLP